MSKDKKEEKTNMKRKYQNGEEFFNDGTHKLCGLINFTKIIIFRKEKPNKNHKEVKYLCDVFVDDKCSTWVIGESYLDLLRGE